MFRSVKSLETHFKRYLSNPVLEQSLSPRDRLSIVLFDDKVYILNQLYALTEQKRVDITRDVDQKIKSGGGTSIAGGVSKALEILEKRTQKSTSCGILVLSDGQDNRRTIDFYAMVPRAERVGCPIFSFGIGSDHDAEYLESLSCFGGVFTYINNSDVINDAFGRFNRFVWTKLLIDHTISTAAAVNSMKATAIKNVEVTVKSSVPILEVFSGYDFKYSNSKEFTVKFSDVLFNETR